MKNKFFIFTLILSLVISLGTASVFADNAMPEWYPDDTENFVLFYDEDASRVVDNADIFTSDEEALMEKRIGEIRAELDRDIVIFTDNSTYGLERSDYAADFYDFNGYGYGEEHEGVCLLICMDPDSRGWWCCCTGSDTKGLYTEGIANTLDNLLSRYMGREAYFDGISEWIEYIRNLYLKGYPLAPDWIPDRGTDFVRTHNTTEPRITDFTDTLTDEQLAILETRAKEISDKYGIDIALNITSSTYGMSTSEYLDNLYLYKGYGTGDDYDGLLVTLHTFFGTCNIYTQGQGSEDLTDKNIEKIKKLCSTDDASEAFEKAELFLDTYDTMRDSGHIPHQSSFWILMCILGILAGAIFGLISTSRAKRKMKTVKAAVGASEYVVSGTTNVAIVSDLFIGSHTDRVYAPQSNHDSDSNSGERSSYSSSYTSSSGVEHSGSGRDF